MLAVNHKVILRNTGMLYARMFFAMAVGLYTSRVVLGVLGVENYGIYHVVAGFVALLGFMQGAMTTATQRYFAYDIGEKRGKNLCCLFNSSIQVHGALVIAIVALAETIGYWFVSTKLSIPAERLDSALIAYHLSVFTFSVYVMTVPYTAMLMANERMGLFALVSIIDVFLKLLAALMLPYFGADKLILYAVLVSAVAVTTFVCYIAVNSKVFPAVRLQLEVDVKRFYSMLSFTAWNTWGNLASALSEHGNNIVLNVFFGPAVNAARSVAVQAGGAINSFVSNVQSAVNPQIVKQYASGQHHQMHDLVRRASKYNFYVLLTLSTPVLFYTHQVVSIWLVEPPKYAAEFLRLTICISLIDALSRPLMTSAQATGKIRLYQSVVGGVLLLNIPLSLLLLRGWLHPTAVLWSGIILSLVALLARLAILKHLTKMPVDIFLSSVIFRVLVVCVVGLALNLLVLPQSPVGWELLAAVTLSGMSIVSVIYILGLDSSERAYVNNLAGRLCKKNL